MPARKPHRLKVLKGGNAAAHEPPRNPPRPLPKAPSCPRWLSKEARAEWRRIVPELERIGLISELDREALAGYCDAVYRRRRAIDLLDRGGLLVPGYREALRKSPAWQIYRDAGEIVRMWARELGLTPAARLVLEIPEPQDNELEWILSHPPEERGR